MWYFIIIVFIIYVGFFIWMGIDARRQKKNNKEEKPPFRSEEDLETYGKQMDDKEHSPVDFDDAE